MSKRSTRGISYSLTAAYLAIEACTSSDTPEVTKYTSPLSSLAALANAF